MPNYIEEITLKASASKPYAQFIQMLENALKSKDKNLMVDILTLQDLEKIKQKKVQSSSNITNSNEINSSISITKQKCNKQYLILTSVNGGSTIHYPLPLILDENPDPLIMRKTIERMKSEMEVLKGGSKICTDIKNTSCRSAGFFSEDRYESVKDIYEENDRLKKRINDIEKSRACTAELDKIVKSKQEIETSFEEYKKFIETETKTWREKVTQAEKDLEDSRSELSRTRSEIGNYESIQSISDMDELKRHVSNISIELEREKNLSIKMNKSFAEEENRIKKEIIDFKNQESQYKTKIKKLEDDLNLTRRRSSSFNYSNKKSSGYGYNSSKNSPSIRRAPQKTVVPQPPKRYGSVPQRKQQFISPSVKRPTPNKQGVSPFSKRPSPSNRINKTNVNPTQKYNKSNMQRDNSKERKNTKINSRPNIPPRLKDPSPQTRLKQKGNQYSPSIQIKSNVNNYQK